MLRSGRAGWFRYLAIIVAALHLASCATLIHGGGTQSVSITTDPLGAIVQVGGEQLISPADISLNRNRDYQVVATKTGYETATSTIHSNFSWVTVLDMVFVLPWVIDLVSGSAYTLSPDTISLVLRDADGARVSSNASLPQAQQPNQPAILNQVSRGLNEPY